jgi:tetratricopeptide (TPR) repeat protein
MPGLALRISRFIAFAFLGMSLLLPWFRVPVGLPETVPGIYTPLFREPITTPIFKGVTLGLLLIALLVGLIRRNRWPKAGWAQPMRIAGCFLLLFAGIIFPALTMQRCSEISAHAGWLHVQHDSLTGPFGDAFTAQEYENQAGQPEVQVKEIFPRAFEVFPTPLISSITELRLNKLEEVLMWIGLSPAFCEFAYWGWFCSLFGSSLLIISFLRTKGAERADHPEVGIAFGIVSPLVVSSLAACVLCLGPVIMSGSELKKSQLAAAEGKFTESLHHLGRAETWLPTIGYHTGILFQRGWLEGKLGIKSSATQLLSAIREEEEGFYSRAAQHYLDLLGPATERAARDEAFRGALRLAIKDFNTGLIDRAGSRLEQLIAIDPTSLKANYALQLVDLRTRQKTRLESDVAQFEAIYRGVEDIDKGVVIASAHRRLADLEYDFGDTGKLSNEMRAAIKPD